MEFDLTKEFVFSTGIQLTPRYSNTVLNYLPKSENEVRVRLNYLQIPVTCYYRKRQMFFGLGGYWGACLWGNWETEERYYDNNIVFNTVTTDEFTTACQQLGQPFQIMQCGQRLTLEARA